MASHSFDILSFEVLYLNSAIPGKYPHEYPRADNCLRSISEALAVSPEERSASSPFDLTGTAFAINNGLLKV